MKLFKKITLPNGLRVILAPQAGSLAATVLVLVEAGSEYETKKINGLSHFLEHLMFKGTTKRPNSSLISSELDALGAEYNAFTGEEYTGYWAKVQNDKLPQIIDLVSDLYLNPLFDAKEIEKERGVIIEEINMYEDTPARRVHELFTELLYGDQPAGWNIAGRKEVIRALARDEFVKYRSAHYVAPKTVVIIAGNFHEAKVMAQIKTLFKGLRRARPLAKPGVKQAQKRPASHVAFKESAQSHLVLGVRGIGVHDKRRHAVQVLANILGGGMSSRLFHRVRDELGAAYYISAHAEFLADHGQFTVSSGVDHTKIEIVVRAILEELRRARETQVPAEELAKAKDHLVGTFILGMETSDQLASYYGGQEILARSLVAPAELIEKLRAVTAEEVQSVAKQLFINKHLNLAVIGPYKNKEMFGRILHL